MHLSRRGSEDTQESFQTYLQNYYPQFMINWASSDIITAIIGFVGLLSTAVILTYSFRRNKTGSGTYQ